MKCSVCKNCSPHLTKVEKKLFCDQCKPNLTKVKIEAAPIKQEIDPESHDSSDSSSIHFSLQKKLKREINLQEDEESEFSEDRSLDMSYSSQRSDDNAAKSNTSEKCNISIKKDTKLKCHLCDHRCNTISSMRYHRKKFHPELGTFRCKICYREFNGVSMLDKHIDEEHDGFGAKCTFCLEKLNRRQRLVHERKCEGRHIFSCDTCGKRYVQLESLRKHLDEHGVEEAMKDLSVIKTRTRERLLICVICDESLVYDEESYLRHVKEQHDGHDCGETHKDSSNHRKSCFKDGPAQDRFIARKMFCPHCPKSFIDRAALVSHLHKNHSENPFSCNECGMKFTTAGAYRYHKERVHSEPKFECPQCPKKFHHMSKLKKHLPIHERGPLECKICGITFQFHIALSYHNHMKHRPRETLECKQCSKRFNLRTHYTIHMREKHGVGSM